MMPTMPRHASARLRILTSIPWVRKVGATIGVAGALGLILAACTANEPEFRSESASASPSTSSTVASVDQSGPIGGPAHGTVTSQTVVATGLEAPWDITFMDDGSMLITERDRGVIVRVRSGVPVTLNGPGAQALSASLAPEGEGGLLGVVQSPHDPSLIYAYVTRSDGNAVVRMTLKGDLLEAPVDVIAGIPAAKNHDGGRIAFGPDGYLYVTTGDARKPEASQSKKSLSGKILRVVADGTDADGSAAPDNPFGTRIFTMGHRNVEGIAWAPDGRMYASEFGQDDRDELNLIAPGANYGWPTVEGTLGAPEGVTLGAKVDGLTYPVAEWPTDDASPSGIAVTREGIYVASLRGERVWRLPLTETGVGTPEVILDGVGRIRDVELGPDGALYVLTNNTDGRGTPEDLDDKVIRITVE
jgi:glucose/arabinose dehydrogenase